MDGVKKACCALGITIHDESALVGKHQSNGAAEITVKQIRTRAGLPVEQIEDQVANGRIIFGCNDPVYCWALLHAAWIHNHFTVSAGLTPCERGMDRSYAGKLAMYGEEILGYLRTGLEAGPRWQHRVCLGKTMSGDQHIVGTASGLHHQKHSPKSKAIQCGSCG